MTEAAQVGRVLTDQALVQAPSPAVSALAGFDPSRLAEGTATLSRLINAATDEDLADDGRYFDESFDDLTRCRHDEIGEYQNRADGELIQFLWNARYAILRMFDAIAMEAAAAGETVGLDPKGDSAVAKPIAQTQAPIPGGSPNGEH